MQELQADRDAAKEESDDLADQFERLLEENGSLDRERANLLSLLDTERSRSENLNADLETERSHSAQLQQQVEELEAKLASVPLMTAPVQTEHQQDNSLLPKGLLTNQQKTQREVINVSPAPPPLPQNFVTGLRTEAATKTEYQTPEVEQTGSDESDRSDTPSELDYPTESIELENLEGYRPSNNTELITPNQMAKLFPDVSKSPQTYRDWAKSAIKGNAGQDKLEKLGYEAIIQSGNYLFRRIDSV